jgi:hypothetical protein
MKLPVEAHQESDLFFRLTASRHTEKLIDVGRKAARDHRAERSGERSNAMGFRVLLGLFFALVVAVVGLSIADVAGDASTAEKAQLTGNRRASCCPLRSSCCSADAAPCCSSGAGAQRDMVISGDPLKPGDTLDEQPPRTDQSKKQQPEKQG